MIALRVAGFLAGLLMVPLMYATGNKPAWLFRPWHDPTGIPDWWYAKADGLAGVFPRFWWSAIRNPANGLRSYPLLSCDVKPSRVEWRDNDLPTNPGPLRRTGKRVAWYYCWHGAYSGLWLCVLWNKRRHMKLRIGWKLVPDEEQFENEWKPMRAGFALSVLPYRRG
jgi:hypothetical protein